MQTTILSRPMCSLGYYAGCITRISERVYKYSCASIKGRGTHYARHKLECSFKDIKNTKYCLQLDIKSFYASIDKDVLVKLLSNKIKDKRVVNLLGKVIYSYSGSGLPLGYYTSSFLANFYLSPLDRLSVSYNSVLARLVRLFKH